MHIPLKDPEDNAVLFCRSCCIRTLMQLPQLLHPLTAVRATNCKMAATAGNKNFSVGWSQTDRKMVKFSVGFSKPT
jgi:hypothetical protein